MQHLIALIVGMLFGAGLALSGMADPARVRGFLDLFGTWDPTLAFVMAGAIVPMAIAWRVQKRLGKPLLAGQFDLPTSTLWDTKLALGAVLFGVGWGIAGLCPGPAIAALALAPASVGWFVLAMLAGMLLHRAQTTFTDKKAPITKASLQVQALNPHISVSVQIQIAHVDEIAALGFRSIICNRPDFEAPEQPLAQDIAAAADAAGIKFAYIPTASTAPDAVACWAMAEALKTLPQPVLAFCRTGARSKSLVEQIAQAS